MRRFLWLLGVAGVLALVLAAAFWFFTRPTKAVTVAMVPSQTAVKVGEVFTMSIVLDNPKEHPVVGADTFLNFDPAYLEVVGPDGKPASVVTPGTILPVLLFNGANNGEGVITYSAGILGEELKDVSITMATISFRAKQATAATKIEYSTSNGRATNVVVIGGESMLAGVKGATVTVQ